MGMDIESLEQIRRVSEARDWLRRYMELRKQKGASAANAWWSTMKQKIAEARGEQALQILINDMNKERNAKGGKG